MPAVIDTGVFVGARIRRQGTTGDILRCLRDGRFTAIDSTEILVEIINVLGRIPFRTKYHIEPDDINSIINLIRLRGELVMPTQKVTACRGPEDDKFPEAALGSTADCIVSGDKDLLDLTPFKEISILRPAEFLARL